MIPIAISVSPGTANARAATLCALSLELDMRESRGRCGLYAIPIRDGFTVVEWGGSEIED